MPATVKQITKSAKWEGPPVFQTAAPCVPTDSPAAKDLLQLVGPRSSPPRHPLRFWPGLVGHRPINLAVQINPSRNPPQACVCTALSGTSQSFANYLMGGIISQERQATIVGWDPKILPHPRGVELWGASAYTRRPKESLCRNVHRGEHEQDAPDHPNRGPCDIRAPSPVLSSHGLSSIARNHERHSPDNAPRDVTSVTPCRLTFQRSILPEILEPIRRERGVPHRRGNRPVA